MRSLAYLISFLSFFPFVFSEEIQEPSLFLSEAEQVASYALPLVKQIVNPLNGKPFLKQIDMVVKGAQPIQLERIYTAPFIPSSFHKKTTQKEEWDKLCLYHYLCHHYKGWQFFPHLRLQVNPVKKELRVTDKNGKTLDFILSDTGIELASPPYGISNVVADLPSGQYDSRNTKIAYENNGNTITVQSPEGTLHIYIKKEELSSHAHFYYLEKEILPNGKILKYSYNDHHQLTCITSLDPKEEHIYASLAIQRTVNQKDFQFLSSCGRVARYFHHEKQAHIKLKEKGKKGLLEHEVHAQFPPLLISTNTPTYTEEAIQYTEQFLLSSYQSKNDTFRCTYHAAEGGDIPNHKVHALFFPQEEKQACPPLVSFNYHSPIAGKKEGQTTVKNADGTKTIYQFLKNLLLKSIQHYDETGQLSTTKQYTWTDDQWLQSIEILDKDHKLLSKKAYEYDLFGNPILETLSAPLTSSHAWDTYVTKRAFSQDHRHLPLLEEDEMGKTLCFTYLPDTNLITAKITKDQSGIILREFYLYDDCNNLLQEIIDNGTGQHVEDLTSVTHRFLKNYILKQTSPLLHLPEIIEHKYLENGEEKLLKQTHLTYDCFGNICLKEVYDEQGELAFCISKTYNEKGDLLSKTDRNGHHILYVYNEKGQCVSKKNLHTHYEKQKTYDLQNHLTSIKQGEPDNYHKTYYLYDKQGKLTEEIDPLGNSTFYSYDPLHNKMAKTTRPALLSKDLKEVVLTRSQAYDCLGRVHSQTDSNGQPTYFRYNYYNQPTLIAHPNGQEYFSYYKNGLLKSHTNQEGLMTEYVYDIFGRPLIKSYKTLDKDLAQESFCYNAFHLLQKTDKEGYITQYSYDAAGRKAKEDFCGKIVEFAYDTLGRESMLCYHNRENTLFIYRKKDVANRMLEEIKTDKEGNILSQVQFSYSDYPNQVTLAHLNDEESSYETFTYDIFGRQTCYQSSLGQTVHTLYKQKRNPIGQKVLQITTLSEEGKIKTRYTPSFFGPSLQKTFAPDGTLLSSKEFFYNGENKVTFKKLLSYQEETPTLKTASYQYTKQNLVKEKIDFSGARHLYTYTPSGQLKSHTLPNDTTLFYSYTPLGKLDTLSSSDGTVVHHFIWNLEGQLVKAWDAISSIGFQRVLDPFGNVVKEIFSPTLFVEKTYDAFHRVLSLTLPDHSQVLYTYDPLHIKSITRNQCDHTFYTHSYEKYGLNNTLLLETLPLQLGQVSYQIERETQKIHAQFHSQVPEKECATFAEALNELTIEEKAIKEGILEENKEADTYYDANGNLTYKKVFPHGHHFLYDGLDQLVEAYSNNKKIQFAYDPMGRRVLKVVYTPGYFSWEEENREYYLYDNTCEIGAFYPNGVAKNLKIQGIKPIAIELNQVAYIPVSEDSTLCYLTRSKQKKAFNPWQYNFHRLEPELNLLYYNNGYYDLNTRSWLQGAFKKRSPYLF